MSREQDLISSHTVKSHSYNSVINISALYQEKKRKKLHSDHLTYDAATPLADPGEYQNGFMERNSAGRAIPERGKPPTSHLTSDPPAPSAFGDRTKRQARPAANKPHLRVARGISLPVVIIILFRSCVGCFFEITDWQCIRSGRGMLHTTL